MKRVAVLTSGGDAPGMNAAVRAVVRKGLDYGFEMFGVYQGFAGLISGDIRPLAARDVGGIIGSGGTFLGSARSLEFRTDAGRASAVAQLGKLGIAAVAIVGGNGSQQGAYALQQAGLEVVGIASTIDNDLEGSDITIGVDTALNIALEAIDRLKTTASSHHRGSIVEVMGRECGYLALMAGLAGGAEAIVIPEREIEPDAVADILFGACQRGKRYAIIVVAEGARNNADKLTTYLKQQEKRLGFEVRATILGHVQRGGVPTAFDRLLGTRLGAGAADCLHRGEHGVLVGWVDGNVRATSLREVVGAKKLPDLNLLNLSDILSK